MRFIEAWSLDLRKKTAAWSLYDPARITLSLSEYSCRVVGEPQPDLRQKTLAMLTNMALIEASVDSLAKHVFSTASSAFPHA